MDAQHKCNAHCRTLASLYLLEEAASDKAKRYRFDPFLREIHEQYCDSIRSIREAAKEVSHVN